MGEVIDFPIRPAVAVAPREPLEARLERLRAAGVSETFIENYERAAREERERTANLGETLAVIRALYGQSLLGA